MTEIEKMFENAGIYPDCRARECGLDYCANSSGCGYAVYPDFTAEKQLSLIKWLAIKGDFDSCVDIAKNTYDYWTIYFKGERWTAEGFEESLAGLINSLWKDLTDKEKEKIRNILNA